MFIIMKFYQSFLLWGWSSLFLLLLYNTKFLRAKNFGEFGELNVIHQYFTHPKSMKNLIQLSIKFQVASQ